MLNTSLKGYIPALGRLLGLSPAALYERQRALVREGHLGAEAGRGPGSGVRATAPSVALVVLSVLATDRLSETDPRVRALTAARPSKGGRCSYTRRESFLSAFETILAATGMAAGVIDITVSRTADRALIRYYDNHDQIRTSEFVGLNGLEPGISVTATLDHNLLQQIAQDVQAIILDSFEAQPK